MDDESKQLASFHHMFSVYHVCCSANQYGKRQERRLNRISKFVAIEFPVEFLGTCTCTELRSHY